MVMKTVEKSMISVIESPRNIVIVGGGTAGWLCASYISKKFPHHNVKVIYSSQITPIGVGESTTPQVIALLDELGVDERHWMRETGASFKYCNKLIDWLRPGHTEYVGFDCAYPLTSLPYPKEHSQFFNNIDSPILTDALLKMYQEGTIDRFDQYFNTTHHYCENDSWGNDKLTNFYVKSHHIDADLTGEYLKKHVALPNGVEAIDNEVVNINRVDDNIVSIDLKNGQTITGDIFVDASGFRRLLIQSEITQLDHPVNAAYVKRIKYNCESELKPYTESIKNKYGWQFKVYLQGRYGSGFVHNQRDSDKLGAELDGYRLIRWTPFKSKRFNVGNCYAIGLSSSFIDPLEGNSLYITAASIKHMVIAFTQGNDYFEDTMSALIDNIYNHLKIFYDKPIDLKKEYFNRENDTESLFSMKKLFVNYMWLQKAIYFEKGLDDWPIRDGNYRRAENTLLIREALHKKYAKEAKPYHIGLQEYLKT